MQRPSLLTRQNRPPSAFDEEIICNRNDESMTSRSNIQEKTIPLPHASRPLTTNHWHSLQHRLRFPHSPHWQHRLHNQQGIEHRPHWNDLVWYVSSTGLLWGINQVRTFKLRIPNRGLSNESEDGQRERNNGPFEHHYVSRERMVVTGSSVGWWDCSYTMRK